MSVGQSHSKATHGDRLTSPKEEDQQWYQVFKTEVDSAAHDPLDPGKRYHDGVFIQTHPDTGKGSLFHVTADVIAATGMRYEERHNFKPGDSGPVHKVTSKGWILKRDYDAEKIQKVLRALPTPSKQQGINFWAPNPDTGRYDIVWTKEDGELYGPGEERRPIFKCNEWTNLAFSALREAGLLRAGAKEDSL